HVPVSRRKNDGDVQVAYDPWRVERYRPAVTPYAQVGTGWSELQVAQRDLVQKFRQAGIAQANLARERIEFQSGGNFKQRERRGPRPGWRGAGNRMERGPVAALALKPAEQFRQPPLIHVSGGAKQSAEQSFNRALGIVACHAERDQCVVMRPDRAV